MTLISELKAADHTRNGKAIDVFSIIRNEMDLTFDHLAQSWSLFSNALVTDKQQLNPFIDVHENQFQFIIECELPGVEEDDISISIYNGQLFIKGHKHSEREEKKDNLYISERSFGSFERRLHLPENIDIEKIEAKFDKGILNIIFQKDSNLVRNEIRIPINR